MVRKKGLFFTIDAILAVGILLGALMVISTFYINTQPRVNLDYIATDLVSVLSELKIEELNNSYIKEMNNTYISKLIENGNITHTNYSILEQIGEFWAEGNSELVLNFTKHITEGIVPSNYGFGIYINQEVLYNRTNITEKSVLSTSSKVISGMEKSKPIEGTIAQTYLLSIQKKKSESYAYFGGLVGQGNISKYITDIPPDANITEIILELNAADDFEFYINGNYSGNYTPLAVNMSADRWDLSQYNASILNGTINEFEIKFLGGINTAYLGGGFIKVKYTTSEMISSSEISGKQTYWFPGIEGIMNIYSAINIPGTLTAWRLNLTLYNNYSTFLVIGNETVANLTGSNETQFIYRERNNLSIPAGTIPIRLGIVNITQEAINANGTPADVILSTDVSGSMSWCVETPYTCTYWCWGWRSCSVNNASVCWPYNKPCGGGCSWPSSYSRNCVDVRLDVAKNASKTFIDTVLNSTGNQIGLNSYSSNVQSFLSLTDDKPTLFNRIDSYTAVGGTCICCGINRARSQLAGSTNQRSIVVMSDGAATMNCSNYDDYTGSGSGSISDPSDKQWAINAGQYACNNQSIDVYTVAFGEDADYDTLKQVACNENMSFNASGTDELAEIYKLIAGEIGLKANYSAQIINMTGSVEFTKLYPNSTIEFDFIPLVPEPKFGEITIDIEDGNFKNCSPQVYLFDDITVTDVKMTSYSSIYWTDVVTVNGVVVWNLSEFGDDYQELGDPFVIQIPPNLMVSGAYNNFTIKTGENPLNNTGCSKNNSLLVYRGKIKGSVAFTEVLAKAEGCNWLIEFDDGTFGNMEIPINYSGTKECNFTSSNIYYDVNDTIDTAALQLFQHLDFDDDNMSNVNIGEANLYVGSFLIPEVPSMWGPAVAEVRVW